VDVGVPLTTQAIQVPVDLKTGMNSGSTLLRSDRILLVKTGKLYIGET
jgi:hypothetical protein